MRLGGGLAYLRATLRGEAQPNPLSWLLWGITPLIAFAAELSACVGPAAVVTLALGISPLMVFTAAMIKNPRSFKLDRFNLACGLFAIAGIALWKVTNHPELAIVIAIMADLASGLPTIRKTIRRPRSEYAPTYAISATSMILAMLTIRDWTFTAYAFPLYVLVINTYMVGLITGQRRKLRVRQRKAVRRVKRSVRTVRRQQLRSAKKLRKQQRRLKRTVLGGAFRLF
jgi:hypothetical protein